MCSFLQVSYTSIKWFLKIQKQVDGIIPIEGNDAKAQCVEVVATHAGPLWAQEGHGRTGPVGAAARGRARAPKCSVALKKWFKS